MLALSRNFFCTEVRRKILSSLVLTAAIGTTQTASSYEIPGDNGRAELSSSQADKLSALSEGLADLADYAKKALVYISISKTIERPSGYVDPFEFFFGPNYGQRRAPTPRQSSGLGSGFFIDTKKGYIVTNNHVIEGADKIELKLANGKTYSGKIVGRDANTDIAVVQITDKDFSRKDIGQLTLSEREPKVGEFSVALGAPFGLEASISFGVISAMGRNDLRITKLGNFIQTDAAINPGNSGGPLIDMKGKVIGVNTAIYSKSGGYNGIGFAVPSKLARSIATKLINDGRVNRGYIGVELQELNEDIASEMGLDPEQGGAIISNFAEESPAREAGLEPGDVITEVAGTKIQSINDLVLNIGTKSPGDRVKVTAYRSGRKITKTIKIGAWPGEEVVVSKNDDDSSGTTTNFGLTVQSLTSAARNQYGFESKNGVVITNVKQDSPAAEKGLRPGDVILTVNGKSVDGTRQFKKLTRGKSRVLLRIERQEQFFFVALKK